MADRAEILTKFDGDRDRDGCRHGSLDVEVTLLGIAIIRNMVDWNERDIELESVRTGLLKLSGAGGLSFVPDAIRPAITGTPAGPGERVRDMRLVLRVERTAS